jgi:hypothetical protein
MTHVHDEACAASSEANDRYLRCHSVGDVLVAIYNSVEAHILSGCLPLRDICAEMNGYLACRCLWSFLLQVPSLHMQKIRVP